MCSKYIPIFATRLRSFVFDMKRETDICLNNLLYRNNKWSVKPLINELN